MRTLTVPGNLIVFGEIEDFRTPPAGQAVFQFPQDGEFFIHAVNLLLAGGSFILFHGSVLIVHIVAERLHFLFFPLSVYVLIKTRTDWAIKICFLNLIMILIFVLSGTVFWCGDRYIITALPIWVIIYTYVVYRLIYEIKDSSGISFFKSKGRDFLIIKVVSLIFLLFSFLILYIKNIPNLTSY